MIRGVEDVIAVSGRRPLPDITFDHLGSQGKYPFGGEGTFPLRTRALNSTRMITKEVAERPIPD
jgi:hypothetical protein